MAELFDTDWFTWGIGIVLSFQVLLVVLGELIYRGRKRNHPLTHVFQSARNLVLPLVVIYLFQLKVLGLDPESTPVRVVATAFWISMVYAALRCLNIFVFEQAPEKSWRHRAPSLFQDIMRLLLIAIGVIAVLSVVWRQDLGAALAALGVGSIVIGLALQETLGNLMAGIALLFERPFTIGDWITVDGEIGEVEQINWRSVHLRTREDNLLVFPNAVLGREKFINFTRPENQHILRLPISFELKSPPTVVKQLLVTAAGQMAEVLDDPAPRAFTMEILDDRIRYEAFLHVDGSQFIPSVTDIFYSRVWYMAKREDIGLPLPTAIEIRRTDVQSSDDTMAISDYLAVSEGFSALTPTERDKLAKFCKIELFGQDELLVERGQRTEFVFIIASGKVSVEWGDGDKSTCLELEENAVIGTQTIAGGNIALLEARAIEGDTVVVRLPLDEVTTLVHSNTALSGEFSTVWADRLGIIRRLSA